MGVPDLAYINRKIPIIEVARALDLRIDASGKIHCWHPELHHNGDRTASVGVRSTNNTVKCFGCGVGPLGPVDLVMNVLQITNPGEAARWIADRFKVPDLPAGVHLVHQGDKPYRVGFEGDIELLVRSGLWARLSSPARSIAPVLLELSQPNREKQTRSITISYQAISRYSGVCSLKSIAQGLRELQEIGWLEISVGNREPGAGPVRTTNCYLITPRSDVLIELANTNHASMKQEIEVEKKLRAEARSKRKKHCITQYNLSSPREA